MQDIEFVRIGQEVARRFCNLSAARDSARDRLKTGKLEVKPSPFGRQQTRAMPRLDNQGDCGNAAGDVRLVLQPTPINLLPAGNSKSGSPGLEFGDPGPGLLR
jgi:hypothetical protein